MRVTVREERMSDIDAVVWAIEREPRLRTTIAALARLDSPLDRQALRHRVERVARRVPRLRQRVVTDPLGLAPPRWSPDPGFQLSFHLRHARLGGGGTERDLLDLVRDLIVQPFDRARPLWEVTVVDGLHDGGTAVLLKTHHSVSDGVGGVELMLELFDLEAEPAPERHDLPPVPEAVHHPPTLTETALDETRRSLRGAVDWLERAGTAASTDIVEAARSLGETLGSAGRLFRPEPAPRSPLMRGRSDGLDIHTLTVDLGALRAAGARVGGTINDAFVAAVAIGVSDHHQRMGSSLDRLRVYKPINTRAEGEDGLGNHWTPGRVDLAIEDRPDAMTRLVRDTVSEMRREPGHALLDPVAGLLRRLPSAATAAAFSAMAGGIDIAASNVPGSQIPLHLCGQEITAIIPFGPLSGTAANVTLMSHAGTAHIGITTDPAAVDDPTSFARDLDAGFASVVKGS